MSKIKKDVEVEVTDITANGCTLRVRSKEYHLSFVTRYPCFLGVPAEEIKKVSLCHTDLQWESLDIYISIDSLEHPRRYPYLMLSKDHLRRIQDVLAHTDRYPGVKFTKRQRERLQSKIDKIAE